MDSTHSKFKNKTSCPANDKTNTRKGSIEIPAKELYTNLPRIRRHQERKGGNWKTMKILEQKSPKEKTISLETQEEIPNILSDPKRAEENTRG